MSLKAFSSVLQKATKFESSSVTTRSFETFVDKFKQLFGPRSINFSSFLLTVFLQLVSISSMSECSSLRIECGRIDFFITMPEFTGSCFITRPVLSAILKSDTCFEYETRHSGDLDNSGIKTTIDIKLLFNFILQLWNMALPSTKLAVKKTIVQTISFGHRPNH